MLDRSYRLSPLSLSFLTFRSTLHQKESLLNNNCIQSPCSRKLIPYFPSINQREIFPTAIYGSFVVLNCKLNPCTTLNLFRTLGVINSLCFRFSFRCCGGRGVFTSNCRYTSIQNRWKGTLRYRAPRGYYFAGAYGTYKRIKK